jgi:hypothetical protein
VRDTCTTIVFFFCLGRDVAVTEVSGMGSRALWLRALGGAVRAGGASRQPQPAINHAASAAAAAWRPLHDRRSFHVSRRAPGIFDGLKQQVAGGACLSVCARRVSAPQLHSVVDS